MTPRYENTVDASHELAYYSITNLLKRIRGYDCPMPLSVERHEEKQQLPACAFPFNHTEKHLHIKCIATMY